MKLTEIVELIWAFRQASGVPDTADLIGRIRVAIEKYGDDRERTGYYDGQDDGYNEAQELGDL